MAATVQRYDSASARNNAYLRRLEKQEIFKGPCDREAEKRRFYAFRRLGRPVVPFSPFLGSGSLVKGLGFRV